MGGRTPGRPARSWPRVAAALLAALVAGVATLAGAGALLVHPCLPGDGAAGAIGLRLALLSPDADCPSGTLALGAEGPQAVRLVLLVALPVVLAHVVTALAGVSALVAVRTVWREVRAAVRARVRLLPVLAVVVRRAVRTLPPVPGPRPVERRAAGPVRRRGPPVLLPA